MSDIARFSSADLKPASPTRRDFLQTTAAGLAATQATAAPANRISPNDRIRFALVGIGSRAMMNGNYALNVPGSEMAAACDVYDGKLTRAREVWGKDLWVTRDYGQILARPDIDAVILVTPDHLHASMAIAALEAGKHVFLEKPMVHHVAEGAAVIAAWKKSGRTVQVGSQYTTSVIYRKVRELLKAGAIGELNMVEAWFDRNTSLNYFIPPDASPATIDWDRFLGPAPKRPFDPDRLFRWRNYREYSAFPAGDLFVHLLGALHVATDSPGPTRIYASGGLRYWKDLGDCQDLLLAVLDYPAAGGHGPFNLVLRANLKAGLHRNEQFLRFVGSNGVIKAGSTYPDLNYVELRRGPAEVGVGYTTVASFPKAIQDEYFRQYRAKHPDPPVLPATMRSQPEEIFTPPAGHEHPFYAEQMHFNVFFDAIRHGTPVSQDPVAGFRAAAPAQLCNTSYVEQRICKWDPVGMREA
jgi:predicted dehydrogenase